MKTAQLVYSIICDDVRIEMGNKLSLMGLFENIFFQTFPSALLKFAIVNHWVGNGQFETHVKILAPDRKEVVVSVPSKFGIEGNGYADNVTFFTNVSFDRPAPTSFRFTRRQHRRRTALYTCITFRRHPQT